MCSSCRRSSPSSARLSSGSKSARLFSSNISLSVESLRRLDQGTHDARPGAGEIATIVTAAAHRQQPPIGELPGQRAQARGGVPMRVLGEAQVRDRIALEAVGAALKQKELRARTAQVRLDLVPRGQEVLIR